MGEKFKVVDIYLISKHFVILSILLILCEFDLKKNSSFSNSASKKDFKWRKKKEKKELVRIIEAFYNFQLLIESWWSSFFLGGLVYIYIYIYIDRPVTYISPKIT